MTDGTGDRSKRPHQQPQPDSYLHIAERRKEGIVLSGVKAIAAGAPYIHEVLVVPGGAKFGQSTRVLLFDQVLVPWSASFSPAKGSIRASSPIAIYATRAAIPASRRAPDLAIC